MGRNSIPCTKKKNTKNGDSIAIILNVFVDNSKNLLLVIKR